MFDTVRFKVGIKSDWNCRAEAYHNDWVTKKLGPFKATDELLRNLEINPEDSILDIACGTGAVSMEVNGRLNETGIFVGIDISHAALLIANSQFVKRNSSFIEMDAENLGLFRKFDKVTCQYALPLFPDAEGVLRSVKKIMTGNAKIGIVVHGKADTVPYLNSILKPISRNIKISEFFGCPSIFRFGCPSDLERILLAADFCDVEIREYCFYYEIGSFEQYWRSFFSTGYSNSLRPLVFKESKKVLSRIKSESEKLVSQYISKGTIQFPWKVLIAFAKPQRSIL